MSMRKGSGRSYLLTIFVGAVLAKIVLMALFVFPNIEQWEDRLDYRSTTAAYDDNRYLQIAWRFSETGKMVSPYYAKNIRSAHRTPGYPYILSVLGRLCGWNLPAMLTVQALALSLIPVLFGGILLRREWVRWPAWLLVVDPLINILSLSFMTEGWLALALMASVYCWQRGDRFLWRMLSFLFFSAAILVKPSPQYFYAVFIVLVSVFSANRPATWMAVVLSWIPLGLWMARNAMLCGLFCLSTQTDSCIAAKFILESKERNVPVEKVMQEYSEREGQDVMRLVTDNKIDFKQETSAYLREHKTEFIKYHMLGTVRVLLGTAKVHVAEVFFSRKTPSGFIPAYNIIVLLYYIGVYSLVLFTFQLRPVLKDPVALFSVLFIGYNLCLIGIFAYLTGGGLKRMPFLPFLYLLLAHGATQKGRLVWQRLKAVVKKEDTAKALLRELLRVY
jgi:hypothetical protein